MAAHKRIVSGGYAFADRASALCSGPLGGNTPGDMEWRDLLPGILGSFVATDAPAKPAESLARTKP